MPDEMMKSAGTAMSNATSRPSQPRRFSASACRECRRTTARKEIAQASRVASNRCDNRHMGQPGASSKSDGRDRPEDAQRHRGQQQQRAPATLPTDRKLNGKRGKAHGSEPVRPDGRVQVPVGRDAGRVQGLRWANRERVNCAVESRLYREDTGLCLPTRLSAAVRHPQPDSQCAPSRKSTTRTVSTRISRSRKSEWFFT